jgi:hypothetical protein
MLVMGPDGGALIPRMFCGAKERAIPMTEAERYPLAEWMDEHGDWKAVPRDSALYEFVAKAAGCDGRVFSNSRLPELVMCDGSDIVLWKMGDVRGVAEEATKKQRTKGVQLALWIAEVAADITNEAVQQEREECAEIADQHCETWSVTQRGVPLTDDAAAAASAASTIAKLIRKRGEPPPEHGGDVVDDAGPGGDRPSQPPPNTHLVPENACLSCGQRLNRATKVEGNAAVPEPGNITICLHCGHLMAFADDLTLRELNDKEAHDVAGDPEILQFQRIRGKFMAEKQETKSWSPPPASPPDDSAPLSPEAPKND